MEDQNITEIICILDKSGSMEALQQETITGLNQFIHDQKQLPGTCNFSLVQFNQEVTATCKRMPVHKVPDFTADAYQPDGYTALYDAIGTTLNNAIETHFFLAPQEQPKKVLVFIITDGMENASRQYSRAAVQRLISGLTLKGWEFKFFGANIDAFGEAEDLGIAHQQATQWEYSKKGMTAMMCNMSVVSREFRKK